jgi:hypothetical protein
MKKKTAFLTGLLSVLFLAVFAIVIDNESIGSVVPGAILGIVGLTTAFIGGNVADNGVKGKYYDERLAGK